MKTIKISKSKLWQKTLDDYMSRFDGYITDHNDVKDLMSYQFMELGFNCKILWLLILETLTFGLIVKVED